MRAHPEDRPAFERHCTAESEEVFQPERTLITAMGMQPVVAHADSKANREIQENGGYDEISPAEVKKRGNGANMEDRHHGDRHPVQLFFAGRKNYLRLRGGT